MICSECGASLLNPGGGIPLNRLEPYNGEWYIVCKNCSYSNLWEVEHAIRSERTRMAADRMRLRGTDI